jgi:hypothetical protein
LYLSLSIVQMELESSAKQRRKLKAGKLGYICAELNPTLHAPIRFPGSFIKQKCHLLFKLFPTTK